MAGGKITFAPAILFFPILMFRRTLSIITSTAFVALLVITPASAFAETSPGLRNAERAATNLRLARDPQWLALLHYDTTFPLYSASARAHSSPFFLATDGAANPESELTATLKTFFEPDSSDADSHPRCRFPARHLWLSRQLEVQGITLPALNCPRFQTWYAAILPETITLIFPASFLNNPASAFGHTFIRLDQHGQTQETRLLAYAADFAAATSGEDPLSYAMKGIFGGYHGFYSVAPYHQKVTKYSDLENRDIWEYELTFAQDEVRLLASHLWELRDAPFTYYYFDENCSYHILALLDVARPSLQLAHQFRTWVLPVDTIRELLDREGLLKQALFRPSAATRLHNRITLTSRAAQSAALELADSARKLETVSLKELTPSEQAHAYDLAFEYQTYQRIKSRSDGEEEKARAWELLNARSGIPSPSLPPPPAPRTRPEGGHKSAMLSVGIGRQGDEWIEELLLRPAFHALSDRAEGHLPGSQIKFFETVARYSSDSDVSLERFTALDITSLTPRDRFFQPLSWRVNLEGRRIRRSESDDPFVFSLAAGAGASAQLSPLVLSYAILSIDTEASKDYQSEYALGAGPQFGIIATPEEWLAHELLFSAVRYPVGDTHTHIQGTLSTRLSLSTDSALRLELTRENAFDYATWSSILRYEYFFTP